MAFSTAGRSNTPPLSLLRMGSFAVSAEQAGILRKKVHLFALKNPTAAAPNEIRHKSGNGGAAKFKDGLEQHRLAAVVLQQSQGV